MPRDFTFLNYLRCHDDIGWGLDYSYLGKLGIGEVPHKKFLNDYLTGKWAGSPARGELYNDDPRLGDARLCGTIASLCGVEAARFEEDEEKLDWALRQDIALHALMFTLSGIPVLYSGDEVARENDYSYHNNPLTAPDSRYLHRGKMDWDAAEKRGLAGTPEHRIFSSLSRLEELRRGHRVFHGQADTWVVQTFDDNILGIGRYYQGEKLVALFSFADQKRILNIREDGRFTDLMTGSVEDLSCVSLLPGDFRWLLCDFQQADADSLPASNQ